MAFNKQAWQREYMRLYRRKSRKTMRKTSVRQNVRLTDVKQPKSLTESLTQASDVPKAISYTNPTLITTHRFEIRANALGSITPTSLPNVQIGARGGGKRIKYAFVDLHNCWIEFYRNSVCLVLKAGHEITNADPERVQALMDILATVCARKGVRLVPQPDWKHGLYSHTVMEDNGLNEFFKPLAVGEWGDEDLHFFMDKSHSGKVEMGGKRSFDAAENLRLMLLEFPKNFHEYNVNIQKHLAVLDSMDSRLNDLGGAVKELTATVKELKK